MGLSETRRLIRRHKSFLGLTVATLIGPALISYNHGSVESKPAVIGDGKDKQRRLNLRRRYKASLDSPRRFGLSVDSPQNQNT